MTTLSEAGSPGKSQAAARAPQDFGHEKNLDAPAEYEHHGAGSPREQSATVGLIPEKRLQVSFREVPGDQVKTV
ncbi:hypothetical protein [Rathayibacter iranicus]|uniref:hypothetical protein n=1 Tax=Rathayibacter iranicus TaxID=59737 RepID=UPI000FDB7B97|nr:hypothetical protein [Rathayibacter iranicus]MWV29610.1 hypothetical protein [Rathayibacter iranicus NCPPB 2253 = VKM Ac-1602]